MASQTPWRWSCKTPKSTLKSSSSSSHSPFPSSIYLCLHINNRRTRVSTTLCLHDPSSDPPIKNPTKSIHSLYSGLDCSDSKREFIGEDSSKSGQVDSNQIESQMRKFLSFEFLFGKKFPWKRILFASTKVRSIILLNVITLVCASNIPVLKEVEAITDPETFTVVRFILTAIPFLPFVLRAKGDSRTRNAGIELGFWVSLGYLMEAFGLLTSDAGRASFISMFTVIVVPLLDGMLGAKIPARTWLGAIMSIVGVGMLESSGSPPCVGDLLNFLSALFFGIHMLRTEHISRRTNKKKLLALLGYEVSVVAVFSIVWYVIGGWYDGTQDFDPSSLTWGMLLDWMVAFPWIPALYTGIFSTGLCLWVEMAAMRDVSATETAIIYGLEPVCGAAFAWCLLGERWGTTGWIGAVLVLGGSLTVQILGSTSSNASGGGESISKEDDDLLSEKQKFLKASLVVVRSRKPVNGPLKKWGMLMFTSNAVVAYQRSYDPHV